METEEIAREHCTVKAKAAELWSSFDDNQKTLVRFGMFPADEMQAATAAGFDGRDLAVALMDCASQNGGMRA